MNKIVEWNVKFKIRISISLEESNLATVLLFFKCLCGGYTVAVQEYRLHRFAMVRLNSSLLQEGDGRKGEESRLFDLRFSYLRRFSLFSTCKVKFRSVRRFMRITVTAKYHRYQKINSFELFLCRIISWWNS